MAQVNYPGLDRIAEVKGMNKFLRVGTKKTGGLAFAPVAPTGISRAGANIVYLPSVGIAGTEADLRAWLSSSAVGYSAAEIKSAFQDRVTKANFKDSAEFEAMLEAHKGFLKSNKGEKETIDHAAFVDALLALKPTKGDAIKIVIAETDAAPKRVRKVAVGGGTRKHDYAKQLENMRARNNKGTGSVQVLDVSKLDPTQRGAKFTGNTFVKAINKPANIKSKIPLPAPYTDVVAATRAAAEAFLEHVGQPELIDGWVNNAEKAKTKVVSTSAKPVSKPAAAKAPAKVTVSPKPAPGAVKPASNARSAAPARAASPARSPPRAAAPAAAKAPAKRPAAPGAGRPGRL